LCSSHGKKILSKVKKKRNKNKDVIKYLLYLKGLIITFSRMEKPGLTLPLLTGLSFSSGSPRGSDREDAKNGLKST
jgi:hypothetical protein